MSIDKTTADLLWAIRADILKQNNIGEDSLIDNNALYPYSCKGTSLHALLSRKDTLYKMHHIRTANALHYIYWYIRVRLNVMSIKSDRIYNVRLKGEFIFRLWAIANRLYSIKFVSK